MSKSTAAAVAVPYGVVYLIRNKRNGKVYIGKTTQKLTLRWSQHCSPKKNKYKSPLHNAIAVSGRECFNVVQVGQAFSEAELNDMECRAIRTHESQNREWGYNLTAGGEPASQIVFTKAVREQIGAASRRNWLRSERRQQATAQRKEMWASPEFRQKVSEQRKEINARVEVRDKHRRNSTAMWADPEYRAKHREAMILVHASEAVKIKHAARMRKRNADACFASTRKAAVVAMWADPERKAQIIAKRLATVASRKEAKQKAA